MIILKSISKNNFENNNINSNFRILYLKNIFYIIKIDIKLIL